MEDSRGWLLCERQAINLCPRATWYAADHVLRFNFDKVSWTSANWLHCMIGSILKDVESMGKLYRRCNAPRCHDLSDIRCARLVTWLAMLGIDLGRTWYECHVMNFECVATTFKTDLSKVRKTLFQGSNTTSHVHPGTARALKFTLFFVPSLKLAWNMLPTPILSLKTWTSLSWRYSPPHMYCYPELAMERSYSYFRKRTSSCH